MAFNIIGLSAGHDSACCLLRDGVLVAAVQEERFTRIKNDGALPLQAFEFCLRQAGLARADIGAIAYFEEPQARAARLRGMAERPGIAPARRAQWLAQAQAVPDAAGLQAALGCGAPVHFIAMPAAHAAGAYYFSGYDDAAILTVDGPGGMCAGSMAHGAAGHITPLADDPSPHTPALLYSAVTAYLGFEVNEGEYKVMGLAPYGQAHHLERLRHLLATSADGAMRLELAYFDLDGGQLFSPALEALLGRPARQPGGTLDAFHADVARSLQLLFEEIMLDKARQLHALAPSANLCLAGSAALNCVANARVLRDGPFERLFVQPAAGGAGAALGAAATLARRMPGQASSRERLRHLSWGPEYSQPEIDAVLAHAGLAGQRFAGDDVALGQAVAARLAQGRVVAWFQGRVEFGARALGNRSILADPRDGAMRARINALVKLREGFRPFAPMVLAEKMRDHLALDHLAPFMTETCQVKSPLALPAVTHVDGTARVQTVDAHAPARLLALLRAFDALTACPVLLNTSFNVKGEPVVCTPGDAVRCYLAVDIDCLVIGDVLLEKAAFSW